MKRLLVIGAGGSMREGLFLAAIRRGVETVLVDDNPYNRYDRLATRTILRRADDPALVVDLPRMLPRVDGVVTLSDRSAPVADAVARAYGLPAIGATAAALGQDKGRMRRAFTGSPHEVPWMLARTPADVGRCHSEWGGPLVVKPIDGAASHNVYVAASAAEAEEARSRVASLSHDGVALVESYVPGPECSLEVVVQNRRIVACHVTEKETIEPPLILERQHLADSDQGRYEAMAPCSFAASVASRYEVENAVMHIEAKARGNGWRLMEAAVRPAGDMIPELVELSQGMNLYDAQISLALDEPAGLAADPRAVAGIRFALGVGAIRDPHSLAMVADGLDSIEQVCPLLPAGLQLHELNANWHRAGYVLARGSDRSRVTSDLRVAESRLSAALGLSPPVDRSTRRL